jgi:cytochrome oxidase Cu insertion factor (SCO1/SenC/PrrC family)
MERFAQVAREVLDETEPPWEKSIETRNLMAGLEHSRQFRPTWLDEFFLRRADGSVLYSRDLIGEVWIGSVFFSTCTTHCIEQNRYLRDLQDRLGDRPVRLVSITTDPQTDTPERLRRYASELKAQPNRWLFLTEDDKAYLDRVAVEFLGLFVQGSDHATKLAVVDRWGRVRLRVDWRRPEEEAAMFAQLDELIAERRPPGAQPPTP